ncbi:MULTISPECIES: FixH family protein [Bacillus]|uniref:FixH family protein n=1 Tax=Bacillus TaxID=1386 RepID=UPI00037300A6|nr:MULTISPECIES: FixH family protein [Bacillus]
MKKCWIVLILGVLMLAACGKDSDSTTSASNSGDELPFLDVKLSINPETAQKGDPIEFSAEVSYGNKKVTDADEVKFEIWKSKSQNHEKIAVKHSSNGIYKLEKSFNEEGTYYIYAHVTAEGMHNMPKKEFVVGQPSEPETKDDMENMDSMNEDKDHSSSNH